MWLLLYRVFPSTRCTRDVEAGFPIGILHHQSWERVDCFVQSRNTLWYCAIARLHECSRGFILPCANVVRARSELLRKQFNRWCTREVFHCGYPTTHTRANGVVQIGYG